MSGDHWKRSGYSELTLSEVTAKPVETVFSIVKVNAFADAVKHRTFYPLELSLVSFSLAEGVTDLYTTLIDIGKMPPGSAFHAKLLVDETGLPLPGLSPSATQNQDYRLIASEFMQQIKKHKVPGSRPRYVLFGMAKDLEEACDSLKWLAQMCKDADLADELQSIEFSDLSKWFHRIARIINHTRPAYLPPMVQFDLVSLAEKELKRATKLCFCSEITCSYHCLEGKDKMDACAQNYCLRLVFAIFDEFLEPLAIRAENGHFVSNFKLKLRQNRLSQQGGGHS